MKSVDLEYTAAGGVSGVLTSPGKLASPIPGSKLVILAHGKGETQDSCYQQQLAEALTAHNVYTFRFTVQDLSKELEALVADFTTKEFALVGIVAHADAVVPMFNWAASAKPTQLISLVNVSGAYTSIGGLPENIHVLSVYGGKDGDEALQAADQYAVSSSRSTLRLVASANLHAQCACNDSTAQSVAGIVAEWFSIDKERQRFMRAYQYIGQINRWKDVEGISNFRDFGGLHNVRPGLLFRCALPSKVTAKGGQTMRDLNIKTIFDLRSKMELDRSGVADIDGIDNQWAPVFKDKDLSPVALANRTKMFTDPLAGYQKAYRELLDVAPPSYRQIMLHLRDRPHDGLVIHCTAGKDRTGVICALILLLMGVDSDTVAREYELTTYGLRHEFETIIKAVEKDNPGIDEEGRMSLVGSKFEAMRGTIENLNNDYGGVRNYFKEYCGLTDEDLDRVVENLTADGPGWKWVA